MHLPVTVHRHPRPGDHPDRPEPGGLTLDLGPEVGERGGAGRAAAGNAAGEPGGHAAARDDAGNPAEAGAADGAGESRHVAGDAAAGMVARNVSRGTVIASTVETADSLWAKFLGLMGRPTLAPGHALWLPESNGIHMMFMRFPIDAVFVGRADMNGARPIMSLYRDLRAWTGLVPLVRGAHGVLELPVGTIDASASQVGDLIELG